MQVLWRWSESDGVRRESWEQLVRSLRIRGLCVMAARVPKWLTVPIKRKSVDVSTYATGEDTTNDHTSTTPWKNILQFSRGAPTWVDYVQKPILFILRNEGLHGNKRKFCNKEPYEITEYRIGYAIICWQKTWKSL